MMMDRIARTAEGSLDELKFENIPIEHTTSDAISRAAYSVAKECGADAIITPTWSGSTACRVSRFRPKQPIFAMTPNEATLDFLSLCWGVIPIPIPESDTLEDVIRFSIAAARGQATSNPARSSSSQPGRRSVCPATQISLKWNGLNKSPLH
jgi:pyruvate kinase